MEMDYSSYFEMTGLAMLIVGCIAGGLIGLSKYTIMPSLMVLAAGLSALSNLLIGTGLEFKLFGTPFGEQILLFGDCLSVLVTLVLIVPIFKMIAQKLFAHFSQKNRGVHEYADSK